MKIKFKAINAAIIEVIQNIITIFHQLDIINSIAMTSHGPPNKKPKRVGEKSVEEIQSILECQVCLGRAR